MPKKVMDLELLHVTCNHFYSNESPLKDGDRIEVGVRNNPFYSFYEQGRSYPVNTQDGEIHVPAIKFLSAVARGEISCPKLSEISVEVAQHYVMLSRELIMEQVRREVASEAPSRQSCLWMTETLEEARYWQRRLIRESRIVRLRVTGTIHRTDASLLLGDSEPISVTFSRARSYWLGEHTDNPEPEILFQGTASVIEILT